MTPKDQKKFEQELAELRERFDPAEWHGQPLEILHAFDEVGHRYEGDIGKQISDGANGYLDRIDNHLTQPERATLAITEDGGYRERRLRDLNNDPSWIATREIIQNEHDRDYQTVWRQVGVASEEVAQAHGIDLDKARREMQHEAQQIARAEAGKLRERPPQELAVWDAAERRHRRLEDRDFER